MHKGSCLCGTIQYTIGGELGPGYFCHCQRCRKAGGSAFGANALAQSRDFAVSSGAESLTGFDAGKGIVRYFCKQCGSPIISRRADQPNVVRVRLGTLDTPLASVPSSHIFVGSKAQWDVIHDDFPQYQERPPA